MEVIVLSKNYGFVKVDNPFCMVVDHERNELLIYNDPDPSNDPTHVKIEYIDKILLSL